MRKIIFVTQASGRKSDPLKGAGGRRLAALAGIDHAEFAKRFERVTLEQDLTAARSQADGLREHWRGRRAVLLGRGVAVAFRLIPEDFEWFKPIEIPPGVEVAGIPETAGIGNWWNDPANVSRARDFVLKLQFLAPSTRSTGVNRGRPAQFTEDEVAAALIAGRGIYTWAAKVLAEETGLSCSHTTIMNYVEKYPRLAEITPQQKYRLCDFAEHNVVRSIEDGDVDSSWKLLRSQMANGRGYALQVNGKVHVSGQVDHRHAHLHAGLGRVDTSKYSVDQLRAIEEFMGSLSAAAGGVPGQEPEPGVGALPPLGGREGQG